MRISMSREDGFWILGPVTSKTFIASHDEELLGSNCFIFMGVGARRKMSSGRDCFFRDAILYFYSLLLQSVL